MTPLKHIVIEIWSDKTGLWYSVILCTLAATQLNFWGLPFSRDIKKGSGLTQNMTLLVYLIEQARRALVSLVKFKVSHCGAQQWP